MNSRRLIDRTGARATRVAAASLLALSTLSLGVGATLAAGGSGSIWTTAAPCTDGAAQNQNLYAAGDTVFVRGANFDAASPFSWSITGQPGGASGDPGEVVASGEDSTDGDGAFCLGLYVVAADDWGVYSVDVTQGKKSKNDNYHVDGSGGTGDDTTDPTDDTTDPADETAPEDEVTDPEDETAPEDEVTDPEDETTDPAVEPGDPADETTDPGDEATDPEDETTEPEDETTDPVDETTDPVDETTDPVDETTDPVDEGSEEPPAGSVDDETSTDDPTDPGADDADDGDTTPPTQSVLGAVSNDDDIELPPTDTVADVVTGTSSIFLIIGLAGLAGAAVLLAPSRRRESEATE